MEVVVVGAGPAGVASAIRAAQLGARTTLLTRDRFGGMAAHDGPVPVRTLAYAARLIRDARQLGRYGVDVGTPRLDYARLLARVREVVGEVRERALLDQARRSGVVFHEQAGTVRFVDPHTLESDSGLRCVPTGSCCVRRREPAAHGPRCGVRSHAQRRVGAGRGARVDDRGGRGHDGAPGRLGVQRVRLARAAFAIGVAHPQSEDAECGGDDRGVAGSGITVREGSERSMRWRSCPRACGCLFEGRRARPRGRHAGGGGHRLGRGHGGTHLAAAGVDSDARGSCSGRPPRRPRPHFAAGDVTGRNMMAPGASRRIVAATNAVRGRSMPRDDDPIALHRRSTLASGWRKRGVVATMPWASYASTRPGRSSTGARGFLQLIADRSTRTILGCHVVGERAVDIVQVVAVAMAGGMKVDELAKVRSRTRPTPLSWRGGASCARGTEDDRPQRGWLAEPWANLAEAYPADGRLANADVQVHRRAARRCRSTRRAS